MTQTVTLQTLTREWKRILKCAPTDGKSADFTVPPTHSLANLPEEKWHVSELFLLPQSYTYGMKFWCDNGEEFIFDTQLSKYSFT